MKKLINEGFIGEIKWIYSNRLNMGKIRTEENVMWSFAPHDIFFLYHWLNHLLKSSVQGTNLFNQNVKTQHYLYLNLKMGQIYIFVSWFHPFKSKDSLLLVQKKFSRFSDTNIENKLVAYTTKIKVKQQSWNFQEEVITFQREPLMNQAKYFLEV